MYLPSYKSLLFGKYRRRSKTIGKNGDSLTAIVHNRRTMTEADDIELQAGDSLDRAQLLDSIVSESPRG